MTTYDQAYADHSYLWKTYGPACDMTGGYVDQGDLTNVKHKPFISKPLIRSDDEDDLIEAYMGNFRVEGDHGGTENVDVISRPSKRDLNRMMRESEYGSVRASLYPERDDLLVIWLGDRVQHHELDASVFPGENEYYIRLFFDATGVEMHTTGEDEIDASEEEIVRSSGSIRRVLGSNFKIGRP